MSEIDSKHISPRSARASMLFVVAEHHLQYWTAKETKIFKNWFLKEKKKRKNNFIITTRLIQ